MLNPITIPLRTVDEFMQLFYSTRVFTSQDGETTYYFACHEELPGCNSQGLTWQEAVQNLKAARRDYFTALLKRGMAIPLPMNSNIEQGQWSVVLPCAIKPCSTEKIVSDNSCSLQLHCT